MKKLLLSLFFVFISVVQNSFAQCDLDFTFTNTGSNMTVFFTPTTANAMVTEMGQGTIGAFFLTDSDVYFCTSSGEITGVQTSVGVMGNDATTDDQDGFYDNQEILWFYESNDGTVYSLLLNPADDYITNAMSIISSSTFEVIDCSSPDVSGCTDMTSCNYNEFAIVDDASCVYPVENFDCDNNCIVDCGGLDLSGCTDATAINYNELATDDDGSCEYETTECILPNSFVLNTGTNMTLMLTPDFITSLNVEDLEAYIVAITDEGLVVGSALVHEDELAGGQVAMPLWGDDATTENSIDGAVSGENINLQLVNGGSLYTIEMSSTITFTANSISAQVLPVNPEFSCSGAISSIMGCTNDIACNYNSEATEDDDSCVFEEYGYNCNGVCNFDTDNDGICDENEVLGCTAESATNYNYLATDDDDSCEYPEPVEGCLDSEANNYNELANIEDGSCLYGIGGCTYPEASNYNMDATYEDESCTFDTPFIYVSNPIDGALLTTPTVSFNYEVLNTIISTDSLAGHLKYSVDGGAYGSIFDQSGEISQDFDFGEHTIQFILYDNVSGNSQPLSPLVQTIINFSVGLEGCMNPLAGNYNLNAIIDNGTCIPNADLEFDNTNTGSNHTLMILMSQIGSINVNGLLSQPGDLLGVFYENDGLFLGAGYNTIVQGNMQIAAWGDDSTTDEQDGFIEGQSFVWAIQYAETGNSVYLEAIYATGSSVYTTNGLSSIIGFDVVEFVDIEGCTNSDYVEYNPFADIEDGSCLTLKVHGCTEQSYLEYWSYDSENLTIELLDVIANTNDGSCVTSIEEGCTDLNYLEYCSDCNVSNNTMCYVAAIPGCTDPLALNFDTIANSNDGTCEYNLCINIDVTNFQIITSSTQNIPVLSYDIINSSSEEVSLPILTLILDTNEDFEISTSFISTAQINPGDTVNVEAIITNDITTLSDYYVNISGYVLMQGQSFDSGEVSCDLAFTEEFVSTIHVGCSTLTAYNYDPMATVNDGSCIDSLQTYISNFNPDCSYEYGSASLFVSGGIAPYTSASTYTHYSPLGIPTILDVNVDVNGTIHMSGLAAGDYSVEIQDSSDIIEIFEFTIVMPDELIVEAAVNTSNLLTSSVIQGNAVFYHWLFEGETIEGSNNSTHYPTEVGQYQVYVENSNGCGAYSENVDLNTVGINELDETNFSLYPNPVNTTLNIRMTPLSSSATIAITDVLGQDIFNITLDTTLNPDEIKIELSDLPNGMYFVVVESNSKQIVKRFIKN